MGNSLNSSRSVYEMLYMEGRQVELEQYSNICKKISQMCFCPPTEGIKEFASRRENCYIPQGLNI